MTMTVFLSVEGLAVAYGSIQAVQDTSFEVEAGQVVALIGANGAGKSTILNAISGLVRAQAGVITFAGQDIKRWSPAHIVAAGVVQVPEGREILARLTVLENLQLGTLRRRDSAQIKRDIDGMCQRFPDLGRYRAARASILSGGQQQMLAIARALLAKPRLLLMDEPSLGLAPQLVNQVFEIIRSIHNEGTTLLLVEQNALKALRAADHAYVIDNGRVILHGTGAELIDNEQIKTAYLGR